MATASQQITKEVTSWPGVEAGPGRRGEFAFRLGRREIGHLHGDRAAHFSFPKQVWAELMEQGRIVPHPVFPDAQGPAARRIEDDADVREIIALLRLNYDRIVERHGLPAEVTQAGSMSDSPVETTIAPWLAVSDGPRAVDYYKQALGAVDVYCLEDDDGRVVVAQLQVGPAAFWVQEDTESSPESRGSGAVRMILTVNDPDSAFEQAVAAGAIQVAPVAEAYGWRTGRVTDPFGHDWEFAKPVETSD